VSQRVARGREFAPRKTTNPMLDCFLASELERHGRGPLNGSRQPMSIHPTDMHESRHDALQCERAALLACTQVA
jgi:hypothetical protein